MIGSLEYFQERGLLMRTWRLLFGIPFFHAHRVWRELKQTPAHWGKDILDIGSGDGLFANQFAESRQARIYGIDRLETRRRVAAATAKFYGLDAVYGSGNFEETITIPTDAPKEFDIILLTDILEHVKNLEPIRSCVDQRLKKQGLVIIQTPTPVQPRYILKDYHEKFGYGPDHHVREGLSLQELDALFVDGLGLHQEKAKFLYAPFMSILWELSELTRAYGLLNYLFFPFFLLAIYFFPDGRTAVSLTDEGAGHNGLFVIYKRL